MAESLGDQIAARLLGEIVAGRFPPGAALPPEWELAAREQVSRLTIREAVRVLRQKDVVVVVRGRGTFVQPRERWSPLDPTVLRALAGDPGAESAQLEALLEARSLVEVGVAELAAARRTDSDLAAMGAALAWMRRTDDVAEFAAADLAFHDAVLAAAGNPVLTALFDPVTALLRDARRLTSAQPEARVQARIAHEQILAAIERRDPAAAGQTMRAHLTETAAHHATGAVGESESRLPVG